MNISKHHARTIGKAVLSHIFLYEVNVLFKELCFIASADQIYFLAHDYNGYAKIDFQYTFWQWHLTLEFSQILLILIFRSLVAVFFDRG